MEVDLGEIVVHIFGDYDVVVVGSLGFVRTRDRLYVRLLLSKGTENGIDRVKPRIG